MAARNILVTGPPRSGKSTLIERVVEGLERPATGFITVEIRERNRRVGFAIVTLAGKTGVLAHQNIKGKFRVGKYGVNIQDLDGIAVPSMQPSRPEEIIVIDEIGKMECFSALFKRRLIEVLDSEHPVIGSISVKGDRFIQRIQAREDVLLITISESTRESALALFLSALQR